MKKIEIFDPALCCSTGVCGPNVDPELERIAKVVSTLQERGASIKRYNPSIDPQAFLSNKVVAAAMEKEGDEILPITLLDDEIVKTRAYPTNSEFITWTKGELGPPVKKAGGT